MIKTKRGVLIIVLCILFIISLSSVVTSHIPNSDAQKSPREHAKSMLASIDKLIELTGEGAETKNTKVHNYLKALKKKWEKYVNNDKYWHTEGENKGQPKSYKRFKAYMKNTTKNLIKYQKRFKAETDTWKEFERAIFESDQAVKKTKKVKKSGADDADEELDTDSLPFEDESDIIFEIVDLGVDEEEKSIYVEVFTENVAEVEAIFYTSIETYTGALTALEDDEFDGTLFIDFVPGETIVIDFLVTDTSDAEVTDPFWKQYYPTEPQVPYLEVIMVETTPEQELSILVGTRNLTAVTAIVSCMAGEFELPLEDVGFGDFETTTEPGYPPLTDGETITIVFEGEDVSRSIITEPLWRTTYIVEIEMTPDGFPGSESETPLLDIITVETTPDERLTVLVETENITAVTAIVTCMAGQFHLPMNETAMGEFELMTNPADPPLENGETVTIVFEVEDETGAIVTDPSWETTHTVEY